MDVWKESWYRNPMRESDYLDMSIYIYNMYDESIVKILPENSLEKLKDFIESGNCSDISFTMFLVDSGIMKNTEIGRRIYHWLTVEIV